MYLNKFKSFFILIFSLHIIAILLLCLVPPVSRDALTHHLAIPKLYLQHGRIHEISDRPFSYYPMNLDLLYLIPLYFGNDIVPKFIHFIFALLTAWLIYNYLRKRTDSRHALLGGLFFLSIPIIVKLSITVYVDLGLIFFSTACLLAIFRWLETQRSKWLIVSGALCGLALGTKYNGLISLFLFTLFIPFGYLRYPGHNEKSQGKALGLAALFLLVSIIVFSPWMIRNYIWTKNPVFPLFNQLITPFASISDSTPMNSKEIEPNKNVLKPFALRKLVYNESWWEIITIPVRIFFSGKDDDPKHFDGRLNPFLILFPLLLIVDFKKQSPAIEFEIKFLFYFTGLFILIVFFQQDMRIRYVGPVVPLLVILSVLGLYNLNIFSLENCSPACRKFLAIFQSIIISLFLIYNISYIVLQFKIVDPFSYLTRKIDREGYIERFRPEYAVIRYANHALSKDDMAIAFFLGDRGYYMDFDVSFNKMWLEKIKSFSFHGGNLLMELKNNGITHIILRLDLFNAWINNYFNEQQKTNLAAFFQNHTKLLYFKAGYSLYMINP